MKFNNLFPVFQALFVTFLWSTSFIIIKWGLEDIPPIVYAGLRYSIAFAVFIPFIIKKKYTEEIKSLNSFQWKKLTLLGIIFYAVTQGTQFIGLSLLSSVTVSLILNFTPIVVAVTGIFLLNEKPTNIQWLGAVLFLIGIITYFFPVELSNNELIGFAVMFLGVVANSASSILGRKVNREKNISPLVITFISMGIGSIILILIGIITEGIPQISIKTWFYLLWLAIVNTAFAFTLWNHTLRFLSAMESSIINGTMLIQIGILAWIFLGEEITIHEGVGMFVAALGAVCVQLKKISFNKK